MKFLKVTLTSGFVFALLAIAPSAQAADPMTNVTLNFVGVNCEGCTVSTPAGETVVDMATIKNGTAILKIATADTAGIYFSINNPKFGDLDAATIIVMQYRGTQEGDVVTRKEAKANKRASACWSGTDQSDVAIKIRLSTVKDKDMSGKSTKSLLSWAQPTLAASGGFMKTNKGRILINGDITCS